MSKILVIAEKPSVAREIAQALGVRGGKRRNWIEGSGYVVTWAVGHLVNIAEPGDQNPAWRGRWSMAQLPMLPRRFALAVLPKTKDQFEAVKRWLTDPDVSEVVNATDAGREGELIFRRIYVMAKSDKPIRRLWANDMTERGLKKALDSMLPGEDKRNLGLAAFARAESDWLIGMNLSRMFTVRHGELMTVGRVQTPVLKLLADRRREIEDFTPRDFWTLGARLQSPGEDGQDVTFDALRFAPPEFTETRVFDLTEAEALAELCKNKSGTIISADKKKRTQKPPLPFDLTTLQREANTRHGLSAKQTLAAAQSLYETKKLLTYPRTDSQYLTTELFAEVLEHMRAIYHLHPELAAQAAARIKEKKKFACVNDKKVSDHHAIIPTTAKGNPDRLNNNEALIYDMVCRRFLAAFLPGAKYLAATVWAEIEEQRFKATGKVFKDKGWLAAEPWRAAQDNPLPDVKKGSPAKVAEINLKQGKTKPPAHYTDATLLGAMETAGKFVEDDQLREAMKERGLGTPATRAQTIETLIARKYVDKKGKKLIASDTGLRVADTVSAHLPHVASPEMTGDWEKRLKDMEAGNTGYLEFMADIMDMVAKAVNKAKQPVRPAPSRNQRPARSGPNRSANHGNPTPPAPATPPPDAETLGQCPACGGKVVNTGNGYRCTSTDDSGKPCDFAIPGQLNGANIPESAAKDLLANGRTYKRLRFTSKQGKRYNAFLELINGQTKLRFEE